MTSINPTCVDCGLNTCEQVDGQRPAFCPTNGFSLEENAQLKALLDEDQNRRIIQSAAHSAHVGHRQKLSHLEETILFAEGIGAKKIGIAACISLAAEARAATRVMRKRGFEVVGAICKAGCITFGDLAVPFDERGADAVLCNPIYQAQLLNEEETDLNVVIGLCAGHDALFLKHADAPCTILAVKDFKFDHNSVRALRYGDESGILERLLEE